MNAPLEVEHKGKEPRPEATTRLQARRKAGELILLPENPAPHITDWLFEVGPVASGSMGDGPISWQEMAAWERITGIELDPWEGKTLRHLSIVYLNMKAEARKPACPPPYMENREETQSRVDRQFAALVGSLKARKRKV